MTRIQVLLTGSHLPWWEPLCKSLSTLRAVIWVIWISGRYLGGSWGAGSQLGLWSWGSIRRDVGGGGEWFEEGYLFWRVLLLHFVLPAQVFSHNLIFELFDPCFLFPLCVPLMNTKRPLSNIWSLSYEQNSLGCFLKNFKF